MWGGTWESIPIALTAAMMCPAYFIEHWWPVLLPHP
jgi:hypothetical protein